MSGFWQRLLRIKPSDASIPAEFASYTDKAIQLLSSSNGQLDDEQVLALFTTNLIPHQEAIELLLFLPTVFCRHMLPQIDWPIYYMEQKAVGKDIKIYYADNTRYLAIQKALSRYLSGYFTQKDYLKIASRAALFKVLNQLLINGGQLKEAAVSPEIIIR